MAAPAAAASAALTLSSLTKRFGDFVAVDDLDLEVPQGSFFALLGPSGCGKTTTLRMVAGLEEPTSGRVLLGTEDLTRRKPYRRPVNTVFQSYALFPHLTIFENVAFGLRRTGHRQVRPQVTEMLDLVELGEYAGRRPAQLSGGQQQRVALARALVNRPKVLLLDEPLGALDLKLRKQMQIELKRIQTEVGITFVHVTHDQEEAMTMADTIAVMNHGMIEQLGAPADLYDHPRSTFVSNFLGQSNLVRGRVLGTGDQVEVDVRGHRVCAPRGRAATPGGAGSAASAGRPDASEVWVGVRPEKVRLDGAAPRNGTPLREQAGADDNVLPGGRVTDVSFIGVSTQYLVRMPWDQELTVFVQNTGAHDVFRPGDIVDLHWRTEHTFLLDAAQDAEAGIEREDVG